MRFYERLYVGDEAKKRRYSIIQAVREGKKTGYWILTLPSNGKNLLDLYPAMALAQPYYKEKDMLILGMDMLHPLVRRVCNIFSRQIKIIHA